jgi:tetratricopeptide (TPR) repeat protein
MTTLPSGTVTFLFTDVEGSTRLLQEHPVAMKDALERHSALLQDTIRAHGGHVFQVLGDGLCSAFADTRDALTAALAAQRALREQAWGEVGEIRVRMGLHTGSAEAREDEYEATTPSLPFVEAIREWAHAQTVERLRAALGHTAPEIAKLAPEVESKLGTLTPNPPLSPGEERLRLFDNAARLLQALAAERGLLVFIDDVHWADQGTLSLLHYLLRHLRNERVLFLAAYREIELDRAHLLASALVEWNRERLGTRVALGRLSRSDTATFLATLFGVASVSDDLVDVLFRETEGNPFFIEEVVKSLIEQGQIYREDGGWGRKETHELTVPQSVKEAIGRRLNRLSEVAVDVLRTAAALGKNFVFRELAGASPANEDALLDALDEASGAQLIRAAPGAEETFAFTHDKIREVLYEELNPIRRRRLHQRIGDALEMLLGTQAGQVADARIDERAPDLAHHYSLAGDLEKSLRYSRRAAHEAERVFAHDEALKYLEAARESADALHRVEDISAIDEQIGDVREWRGMVHPAVESYDRALDTLKDTTARARIKAKIGNAYCNIGDPRGVPYLEQALSELDPQTQTAALALATASMGRYCHYRTEHHKAIEFLERARQLAEPLGHAPTLCAVYTYLAGAHQHLLLYDDADRWARVTIALGERTQFPFAIAVGNEFLSEDAGARGHFDDGIAYARNDEHYGQRAGSLVRAAWSRFCASHSLHGRGDLADALAAGLSGLSLCEQIGESRLATWLEPCTALIYADQGNDEAARAMAERGWASARQLDQLLLSAWSMHAVGYAALLRGEHAEALDWYRRYLALVKGSENGVARLLILQHAVEALLAAGQEDEAAAILEEAIAVATFAKAPIRLALAQRVQATLLASQGRVEEALRVCETALGGFVQCGAKLERGRGLLRRGTLLLARNATGDREAARADLTQARDLLTEAGAQRDRRLAEEGLATP